MDWLKTNDITIILGISFVGVYALSKILKPQSLVHPLLLGRQADVSRVRMPGESAVYRNYATGLMGRLPERPKPDVKLISHLLPDENTAPRLLWTTRTTNAEIKARAAALGAALVQVVGLVPGESTALLLLDNCIEFLITDLALAQNSIVSFTLDSLSLVIPALEKHNPTTVIVHEHFLEHILEHVSDLRQISHHSVIVLGDDKGNSVGHSQKSGVRVLRWEDLEVKGKTLSKPEAPPLSKSSIDILDFAQTSPATPTLMFLTPDFLKPVMSLILTAARSNPLFWLGWRHKIRGLQEGFLTKRSLWDNVVWEPARTKVLDKVEESLRGIVVSQGTFFDSDIFEELMAFTGELETAELENARVAFSVPIVMTYSHPLACGPVLASHPLDLQAFPASMAPGAFKAHFGPPAPNVEAKLVRVDDAIVDAGADPEGELVLRGPSIAKLWSERDEADAEEWVSTGQSARVHTNGTFRLF
ncbi:hypothetical protein M422DRAFT_67748 [Sphaerobolus stellatus SS14]|uniref:Unplaced genomic scaffold SPHSTscaffold_44, whole genome shotgun sequence n=1 Tax=Sphaerobolus stellatus (strain SS14) TaxID=990650 RepID=A0A0C9VAX2_SPHS4|nr:hypothetical protein M422DRAFT_67748 [Sphaerobolus stellatus SS14]